MRQGAVSCNLEARSRFLVLDCEPVVRSGWAESPKFGKNSLLVLQRLEVHDLIATNFREGLVGSTLRFDCERHLKQKVRPWYLSIQDKEIVIVYAGGDRPLACVRELVVHNHFRPPPDELDR